MARSPGVAPRSNRDPRRVDHHQRHRLRMATAREYISEPTVVQMNHNELELRQRIRDGELTHEEADDIRAELGDRLRDREVDREESELKSDL